MTKPERASTRRSVGEFAVTVDATAVAAFAAALGGPAPADAPATGAGRVPMTFPLRWLSEPAIRDALLSSALPDTDTARLLPVHIEQRIDLVRPLQIGVGYRLALWVERPDARRILRVTAALSDADGREAGSLETRFLLVSTQAGDAS